MKRLLSLLALLLPVLGLGQGLAINLNAGATIASQAPVAKALGAVAARVSPHLYDSPFSLAQEAGALNAAGIRPLWNLSYADPKGGSEHRAIVGAEVAPWAVRVGLVARLVQAAEVELGNEPNGIYGDYTPAQYVALVKAALPKLWEAGVKKAWVGSLDASKPNASAFAKAIKEAGILDDRRVGLSWHRYPAAGETIGSALLKGARQFEPFVPRSRQLVTETGCTDETAAIESRAPAVVLGARSLWTAAKSGMGPAPFLVDPGSAPAAHYTAKGELPAGYARVTATLWGEAEGTALLGTYDGEEAVEVAFGKLPRRVSVVVPCKPHANGIAFSLIARSAVRVDGISVEPLGWDKAKYEAHRLVAKSIAYAGIDGACKELGLAGGFAYVLDDDTMTYGLRSVGGKVKAAPVSPLPDR